MNGRYEDGLVLARTVLALFGLADPVITRRRRFPRKMITAIHPGNSFDLQFQRKTSGRVFGRIRGQRPARSMVDTDYHGEFLNVTTLEGDLPYETEPVLGMFLYEHVEMVGSKVLR